MPTIGVSRQVDNKGKVAENVNNAQIYTISSRDTNNTKYIYLFLLNRIMYHLLDKN